MSCSIFGKCRILGFLGMDTNTTDSTSDTKKRKEAPDDNETESEQPKQKKAKSSSTTTTAPASAAAATTEPEKKSARLDLLLISGDDDYGALSIENTITAEGAYRLALEQGGSVRKWPLKYRSKSKRKKEEEKKKKGKKSTKKADKNSSSSGSESDSDGENLDHCYAQICETFTFSDERNRREAFNAVTVAINTAQDYDHSKHSTVIPFERDGDQLESYEDDEDEEESEGDEGK